MAASDEKKNEDSKQPEVGSKPGTFSGNSRPSQTPNMQRVKTIWITKETKPFLEDFEVRGQIGSAGQFGLVYRCRRILDKSKFAVKTINKSRFYRLGQNTIERSQLLSSMQGEIDILRTIQSQHENIINFESVYEDKHFLYIVMEECRGGELMERLQDKMRKGQLYTEQECAKIVKSVCDAIYYMYNYHRIVHCDLKPENILFLNRRPDSPIKLVDFGMSQVLPRWNELTRFVGTPYYTAPEILNGNYGHGADMWSIGVIMFLMLFGYPPFYVDRKKYYGYQEQKAIYRLIKKGFTPELKRGFGPWFPRKQPVSASSRDLIAKLLTYDRENRITAKFALDHEWLKYLGAPPPTETGIPTENTTTENANEEDASNRPQHTPVDEKEQEEDALNLTEDVSNKFQRLENDQKSKLAFVNLFRGLFTEMKPNHFQLLLNIFESFDTESTNTITFVEFKQGLTQFIESNNEILITANIKLTNNELFKEFVCVKDDEEIVYNDVIEFAISDYIIARDEDLYHALRDLDNDNDGIITTNDLIHLQNSVLGNEEDIKQYIEDSQVEQIDGKINYELFLKALHPSIDNNSNTKPRWFYGLNNPSTDNTTAPNTVTNTNTTTTTTTTSSTTDTTDTPDTTSNNTSQQP